MTKLTYTEIKALISLRSHVEGCMEIRSDGRRWQDVYLPSAKPSGMTTRQFDGVLGSLQNKGFYNKTDGDCFGLVNVG